MTCNTQINALYWTIQFDEQNWLICFQISQPFAFTKSSQIFLKILVMWPKIQNRPFYDKTEAIFNESGHFKQVLIILV